MGIWGRLHADLLRLFRQADLLEPELVVVDSVTTRAFSGGEATGPNPTDRRKPGVKHTVMVDRHGVPLVIRSAGANASDHTQILPIVLEFPEVGGKPGRPKTHPEDLFPDRGYASEATRGLLAWMGHRAAHRTKKHRTRLRPGQDALGRGADHLLDQRAPAPANLLRPVG